MVMNKCSFLKTQKALDKRSDSNNACLASGPSSFRCPLSVACPLPACPRLMEFFGHLSYPCSLNSLSKSHPFVWGKWWDMVTCVKINWHLGKESASTLSCWDLWNLSSDGPAIFIHLFTQWTIAFDPLLSRTVLGARYGALKQYIFICKMCLYVWRHNACVTCLIFVE